MKFSWKTIGNGAMDNLGNQMQKIVRSMNQNRFETRYRYISAEKRFIKFAAKEFKLQKLANVQDKHLEKYARHLKEQNLSDKYVKNELSGIRFFHNHTQDTKFEIKDSTVFNKELGLGSTPDIRNIDRAWTEKELNQMQNIATDLSRPEVTNVLECMRATGCRIDEAATLRDSDLRNALQNEKLYLNNTKGGVPREVTLTDRARELFQNQLQSLNRGEYAFTPKFYIENHEIHKFEKSIQNFIINHRNKVQLEDRSSNAHNVAENSKSALTAHGLRHSYAREQYFAYRNQGLSIKEAKQAVSEQMGHHRQEITNVYLGGLE